MNTANRTELALVFSLLLLLVIGSNRVAIAAFVLKIFDFFIKMVQKIFSSSEDNF